MSTPDLERQIAEIEQKQQDADRAAWRSGADSVGHRRKHGNEDHVGGGGGGGNHDVLSTVHTDTFATDVEVNLDLLTWITASMRWEARPASDHGTHGAGGGGSRSATRIIAGPDASAESIAGSDFQGTGANDHIPLQQAYDELPAGGTLHIVGTLTLGDTFRAHKINTRIEFEGGATLRWLTVPVARPILHIANSKIDVINPKIEGSGNKGNGVGILMVFGKTYLTTAIAGLNPGTVDVVSTAAFPAAGQFAVRGSTYTYTSKTATQFIGVTSDSASDTNAYSIGESVGLTTDAGSHDVTIYSPEVQKCNEGVTFGINGNQSTGDCNIFGGALHDCKVGIMSRGFTNRAWGTRAYTNNINVDCSNERTSQKFEGYGLTFGRWAQQCIRVRSGNGTTFHNTWMEHTSLDVATEAVLIGGSTTLGDKNNREVLGCRFTGTTKLTLPDNITPELYGFRLYNCRDLLVEHLTLSTNGAPPSVAVVRAESTLIGNNNRFGCIVLSPGSGGDNTFTPFAYPAVLSDAGGIGSEVIIEQHYDVEGTAAGTTIGGSVKPISTADYTVFKQVSTNDSITRVVYFAKSKNGHIKVFAVDNTVTPISGLKAVIDAIKGHNTSIRFLPGIYAFVEDPAPVASLAQDHATLNGFTGLSFEGDPSLSTILSNWRDDSQVGYSTTSVDSEPLSFTRCHEVHLKNLRIWAGGNLEASSISSDGLDFDGCRGVHLENILVERSRSRGLVMDGGDSGAITRRGSIQGCEVRGIPVPPGALTTTGGALAMQEYRYCVTFVDSKLGETPPSDLMSWTPTNGTSRATLTIPTGPAFDATRGVTQRKVYRWSAAQPTYRLLTTIVDNITTAFIDNAADATIAANPTVPTAGVCLIPNEGIKLIGTDRQRIEGNDVIGTGGHGIQMVRKSAGDQCDGNRILNNNVRFAGKGAATASLGGVYIGGGSNNVVLGNTISDIGDQNVTFRGIGIKIEGLTGAFTDDNLIGPNNIFDDQDANSPSGGATTKHGIQLGIAGGGNVPDSNIINPGVISGMTSSEINNISSTNTRQYLPDTIFNAKGDIISASAADTPLIVPVGTVEGQVPMVAAAEAAGWKWGSLPGGSGGLPKHWFNADEMAVPSGTARASLGATPSIQNVILLADAAVHSMNFDWEAPSDWAGGAVDVVIHYGKSTVGTGNVRWRLNVSELAIDDVISEAGTSIDQTVAVDAVATADRHKLVTFAAAFTPTAIGAVCRINIARLGTDAADTYTGAADVFGVEMVYTTTTGERAFIIGIAGAIPVGGTNEFADFPFPMPFAGTLLRMKATVNVAVTVVKTIRLRSRTPPGGAYADVAGFAINLDPAVDGGLSNSINPADVAVAEGVLFELQTEDALAASGSNLAIQVIYRA